MKHPNGRLVTMLMPRPFATYYYVSSSLRTLMLTELDVLLQRHPELKSATRQERVTFLVAELDRLVKDAVRALR